MLVPLTTDRPQRHAPAATWAILLANVALFVAVKGMAGAGGPGAEERLLGLLSFDPIAFGLHKGAGGFEPLMLRPGLSGESLDGDGGAWWTLLTYQFAHGGVLHLLGNLLILWVFGPSVEDRLGKLGFTLFYLVGGVLAALLHGAFKANPVIGASGAIAAVTGAFLVLFPRTHIKVLIFMVLVGVYELPAWIFIVIAVAKDVWGAGSQADGVAFLAHIGGYVYGFSTAMLLLVTRVLPPEDWTLFAIARHAKRRAEFRASAREAEAEWKRRVEREPARADAGQGAAPPKSQARGVEERVLWQRMDAAEHRTMTEAESFLSFVHGYSPSFFGIRSA
ncbi:MAG: rhomboid family intramembrane serine protease, partial [Phycisphaerales bacterium]|nr:rhomboid family intramembrane serine protease [Phycisphaerales bacterium]